MKSSDSSGTMSLGVELPTDSTSISFFDLTVVEVVAVVVDVVCVDSVVELGEEAVVVSISTFVVETLLVLVEAEAVDDWVEVTVEAGVVFAAWMSCAFFNLKLVLVVESVVDSRRVEATVEAEVVTGAAEDVGSVAEDADVELSVGRSVVDAMVVRLAFTTLEIRAMLVIFEDWMP